MAFSSLGSPNFHFFFPLGSLGPGFFVSFLAISVPFYTCVFMKKDVIASYLVFLSISKGDIGDYSFLLFGPSPNLLFSYHAYVGKLCQLSVQLLVSHALMLLHKGPLIVLAIQMTL